MEKTDRRKQLELQHPGDVYGPSEFRMQYEALQFMAPYVLVRRRKDSVEGTLSFDHSPRLYWGFTPSDT